MRLSQIVSAALFALAAFGTHAAAQNYPWCAYYGGIDGGGENCGFATYEQCRAAISGMGGFCALNTQYVPARSLQATPLHTPYWSRARHHRPS